MNKDSGGGQSNVARRFPSYVFISMVTDFMGFIITLKFYVLNCRYISVDHNIFNKYLYNSVR